MGLKTSGETMQSLNNSSRRCVHVNAIFSPPGCALPKWGVGREAIVFTTCYVMQQGAKAGQTVGLREIGGNPGLEGVERKQSTLHPGWPNGRVQGCEQHVL